MGFLTKMKKRGMGINDAVPLIVTLVVVGVVAGVGLLILSGFQTSLTADTAAYNATVEAVSSIASFTDLLPILGTVFIAVILIAAIIGGLYFMSRRM